MLRRIYAALMIVISLFGTTPVPLQSTLPQSSSNTVEQPQVKSTSDTPSLLTKSEAEAIALSSLGLLHENVRMERTELDRERGRTVWEVEFYYLTTEYDIEVDALTGEIIKTDYEQKNSPSTEPTPVALPTADTTALTEDQALAIALDDAGLTRDMITRLRTEKDRDDGIPVFEIEFYAENTEYDYTLHALTGEILEKDVDIKKANVTPTPDPIPTPQPPVIDPVIELTKDEAIAIALDHAGLKLDEIKGLKVEKDRDDGTVHYEIEFYKNYVEYDYSIHAISGDIIKHEKEDKTPKPVEPIVPVEPTLKEITKDEAIAIALDHAGLKLDEIKGLKVEKDRDDGATVYEIEFYKGRMEYEYELRASDGKILEWDSEYDD